MDHFWNRRHLQAPPTCSLKTKLSKKGVKNMQSVLDVLKTMKTSLEDQSCLSYEQYLLSRLIYKMNAQIRSEKTLQFLKRVKVCLMRFTEMKLLVPVEDMLEMINSCEFSDSVTYLPSRQMMEYLCVRVIGASKLLHQTSQYCLSTFIQLKHQLSIGILMRQNLTFLSLISRIWVLTRTANLDLASWYKALFSSLDILQPTDVPWLPEGESLPCSIKESQQTQVESVSESGIEKYFKSANIDLNSPSQKETPKENYEDSNGTESDHADWPNQRSPECDILPTSPKKTTSPQRTIPPEDTGVHVPRLKVREMPSYSASTATADILMKEKDLSLDSSLSEDEGVPVSRSEQQTGVLSHGGGVELVKEIKGLSARLTDVMSARLTDVMSSSLDELFERVKSMIVICKGKYKTKCKECIKILRKMKASYNELDKLSQKKILKNARKRVKKLIKSTPSCQQNNKDKSTFSNVKQKASESFDKVHTEDVLPVSSKTGNELGVSDSTNTKNKTSGRKLKRQMDQLEGSENIVVKKKRKRTSETIDLQKLESENPSEKDAASQSSVTTSKMQKGNYHSVLNKKKSVKTDHMVEEDSYCSDPSINQRKQEQNVFTSMNSTEYTLMNSKPNKKRKNSLKRNESVQTVSDSRVANISKKRKQNSVQNATPMSITTGNRGQRKITNNVRETSGYMEGNCMSEMDSCQTPDSLDSFTSQTSKKRNKGSKQKKSICQKLDEAGSDFEDGHSKTLVPLSKQSNQTDLNVTNSFTSDIDGIQVDNNNLPRSNSLNDGVQSMLRTVNDMMKEIKNSNSITIGRKQAAISCANVKKQVAKKIKAFKMRLEKGRIDVDSGFQILINDIRSYL